jgi:hypothetical protein
LLVTHQQKRKENAKMDFGEVFTKAWKIIWKYKILWLFGIFAGCSSGGGGGGSGSSGAQYSGDYPYGTYNMEQLDPWLIVMIVLALILLAIIITIIVMAVSTVGRIGLIQGTQLADEDDDAQVTFMGLFNSMKPFFWRVLGLNLLIGVGFFFIIMALVLFIGIGSILTLGIGFLCMLPLICVLIPVFWVLTTFVEMANVALVVEDLGIIDGLKRGWDVFRNNLAEMILIGLVLVLGGMFVGLIIAIPMIMTMIPLMMGVVSAIFGDSGALAAGGVIVSGLCCLAYLPVMIVLGGIIRAYIGSAWTLTFLRLTQGPAVDELVELLPDEPVEPETLPESEDQADTAEVSEALDETSISGESEKAKETQDLLPEDF